MPNIDKSPIPGISPITESSPNRKSVPGILNRLSIQFVIDSSPRNSGGNGLASTRFIAYLLLFIGKTFIPPPQQRLLLQAKQDFVETYFFTARIAGKQKTLYLRAFGLMRCL
jgi:hypothetical protein